jgi:hypothetical protein
MHEIQKVLTFQRMISPALLQLLFWAAIGGTLYGSWVLVQLENRAWPLPLIFGPLLLRVLFERALIAFRSYDRLVEIGDSLASAGGRS